MMWTKLGAAALAAIFLLAATALPAAARERFFGYCINPTTGTHAATCTVTVYRGGSLDLVRTAALVPRSTFVRLAPGQPSRTAGDPVLPHSFLRIH